MLGGLQLVQFLWLQLSKFPKQWRQAWNLSMDTRIDAASQPHVDTGRLIQITTPALIPPFLQPLEEFPTWAA